MGILGIENRTENWKTAYYFSPFFRNEYARLRLAQKIVGNHCGSDGRLESGDVHIELFWKGMRDYLYTPRKRKGDKVLNDGVIGRLATSYSRQFKSMREAIEESQLFSPLKEANYGMQTMAQTEQLARNLHGTEIDVVLASQGFLMIGEAKDESRLGGNGNLNLVHQLIRQYVMARVLVDLKGETREIVPFVIVDERRLSSTRNAGQVEFMVSQECMNRENVLSWDKIRDV